MPASSEGHYLGDFKVAYTISNQGHPLTSIRTGINGPTLLTPNENKIQNRTVLLIHQENRRT